MLTCRYHCSCSPSTVPSNRVRNVMVRNVVNDTAVMISWDPPSDPNGFIRYYRVEFQLIPDSSRCQVAPLASEVMNRFTNFSGSNEAPTSIILDELGQSVLHGSVTTIIIFQW